MSADIKDVRRRAWETRRKKYGVRGHRGTYTRGGMCGSCERMREAIAALYNADVISEGRALSLTGLSQASFRYIAKRKLAPAQPVNDNESGGNG